MASTDRMLSVGVLVLAGCALILTGFNVRSTYVRRNPPAPQPQYVVDDWQGYGGTGHRIGAADAKVTIVMFSDYQCPSCKTAMPKLEQIVEKYHPAVAVVVRHFPIPGHPYARAAAHAAVCAGSQNKFDELHNLLFVEADSFAVRSWTDLGRRAGVPKIDDFEECLSRPETAQKVQDDIDAGTRLGVVGTPTLLINHEQFTGTRGLEEIIKRHVKART
ncbi:MAG: DsbA family protein [Gemmatimonadota bacterium]